MAKILIKNGKVWDGESFFFADVLTDAGCVVKVEPNITDPANYVYDAERKIVSAGLVDIHTHLRGVSCDRFGMQAEMCCFPFGVTSAADAAGGKGDKALLESFALKVLVFTGVNIKDNSVDFSETEKLIELYGDRTVGLKTYFDASVAQVTDILPLRRICGFASRKGLPVMVHCTNSPVALSEILETLNKGDILTHAFNGSQNNAECDNFQSVKLAQSRGVIIDVGFAGNVHTDFGILKRAIGSGVLPDVISTDITRNSAFIRGGRYGMTMCMSIAKHLGMSDEAVFKAVTSTPAKVLKKESEWGYLRAGRKADIAVFQDGVEPFDLTDKSGNRVHSNAGLRCVMTLCEGQIVYKD